MLAGLNYFLTDEARGGSEKKLLGEKRDVKVWLSWLERRTHNDVNAISTPVGYLPKYRDLKDLFQSIIEKPYPEDLYNKQFSLYLDNIIARIDLQLEAYRKEAKVPEQFFTLLDEQRKELKALQAVYGSVVTPSQLEEYSKR